MDHGLIVAELIRFDLDEIVWRDKFYMFLWDLWWI